MPGGLKCFRENRGAVVEVGFSPLFRCRLAEIVNSGTRGPNQRGSGGLSRRRHLVIIECRALVVKVALWYNRDARVKVSRRPLFTAHGASAPVAQRIEHWPPEPGATVRVRPGVPEHLVFSAHPVDLLSADPLRFAASPHRTLPPACNRCDARFAAPRFSTRRRDAPGTFKHAGALPLRKVGHSLTKDDRGRALIPCEQVIA